ncbi:uncharacterized protein EI90DRAFT_3119628 [Cantharellus anzutake]|uniref:uncharacterized protein n=1 Tax=Cantharellus anzutake TaxID=1750568 RepID=UPI0019042277|nr:uncharacterized protein EI90DRAFT_3119628 [Cantharellus anzutake]KAF8336335.1 hypothetical protein EI90DRAFT_3119628 [Cantharellus anzutake]
MDLDSNEQNTRLNLFAALQARIERSSESSQQLVERIKSSAKTVRSQWDSKIYQLSSEVSAVESTLAALNRELALARCGLNRVANASSPYCRIPDALLSDIFAWACSGSVMEAKGEHATLQTISSTCHHWREVALHTPSLWTHIHIKAGEFNPFMHTCLERSVAAHLRLIIELDNSFIQWGPARLERWIDSLAPYFERCVMLKFVIQDFSVVRITFPINHSMPHLREFAWEGGIRAPDEDDSQTSTESVALYDHTKTSPEALRLDILGAPFPIQWDDGIVSRLTTLALDHYAGRPTRDVVELVARCPNLKNLRWKQRLGDDDPFTAPLPLFTSQSLEILDIDFPATSDEARSVLWRMQFPNLRYLCVASRSSNTGWAETALGSSQRFPLLQTLWLSTRAFTPEAMVSFLAAHPTVEEFGCGVGPLVRTLISLLMELISQSFDPPKLRFLYLLDATESPDAVQVCLALGSLIRSRSSSGDASVPLMKVQLNDETWMRSPVGEPYASLQRDFPGQVELSHVDDSVPYRFRPI